MLDEAIILGVYLIRAQIIDIENQIFRQVFFTSPKSPTNSRIG
jgi:hypothetical protein